MFYHQGIQNKVVASHNLNHASSRSHCIFTITVECTDANRPDNTVISKLQLVDLAGSERQSHTGATDKLAKESIDINKSLFTLRQVITALTDVSKSKGFVPYRDSKLTSLLRQTLGGNSYTLMICCITPNDRFYDENLSSINYAAKASKIANKPRKNNDPKSQIIQQLKNQNKLLT